MKQGRWWVRIISDSQKMPEPWKGDRFQKLSFRYILYAQFSMITWVLILRLYHVKDTEVIRDFIPGDCLCMMIWVSIYKSISELEIPFFHTAFQYDALEKPGCFNSCVWLVRFHSYIIWRVVLRMTSLGCLLFRAEWFRCYWSCVNVVTIRSISKQFYVYC